MTAVGQSPCQERRVHPFALSACKPQVSGAFTCVSLFTTNSTIFRHEISSGKQVHGAWVVARGPHKAFWFAGAELLTRSASAQKDSLFLRHFWFRE